MMKRFFCLCFAAVGVTLLAAEASNDSKVIEGTWVPVKAELGGQPMTEDVLKTITLKMQGGKYEVSVGGRLDKGTYGLGASTQPKSITVNGTEGPNQGKTFPAIYELSHDSLRICYDLSGAKRPAEFKTSTGTRLYLVKYTRKKE